MPPAFQVELNLPRAVHRARVPCFFHRPLSMITEPAEVPPNIGKPHALVIKPSQSTSKPRVGKLRYT